MNDLKIFEYVETFSRYDNDVINAILAKFDEIRANDKAGRYLVREDKHFYYLVREVTEFKCSVFECN